MIDMRWLTNLHAGIKALLRKHQSEHDLDAELDAFQEASVEHKIRSGMSADDALQAAMIEMGSRDLVKHRVWSSRWESTVESFGRDLRLGLRTLVKSPGYTAVALISLALGIGANTAIFTLINEVLLRKLPVRDPQQLVAFGDSESEGIAGGIDLGQSGGFFPWDFARQLENDPGPFQGIAAYCSFSDKASVRLAEDKRAGSTSASTWLAPVNLVSGNYFTVLGAEPFLGRTILPSDAAIPGTGAVVVVSYHFWRQALSSDFRIVGKSLLINGLHFEVVGVMPEGFLGIKQDLEPVDLWTPVSMQVSVLQFPSMLTPHSGLYFLHLFGRLSPKATSVKDEFLRAQNWLNEQVHNGIRNREGTAPSSERQLEINRERIALIPAAHGVSLIRQQYGESLQILMMIVALVLLIACANLANFLLARATTRRHETATRLALGSSRMRIVRQSLAESLLLAIAGGLLGMGLAFAATRMLIAFVAQGASYIAISPVPDLKVLTFTLMVSVATAILFGLAPAIQLACSGTVGPLNASARTVKSVGGSWSSLWPKSLVASQMTICILLLVVAGLFLRTLRNLENQDYGFERTHLLLAETNERIAGYAPHQLAGLDQELLERLAAVPGVRSVALAQMPPMSGGFWSSQISLAGYTPAPKENMVSMLNRVSGEYFQTAGIAIVSGRPITKDDTLNSLKVAVVNQTLAKRYFPKGGAIGKLLTIDMDSVKGPWQIVGIAKDTKPGNPRDTDPVQMTYIPLAQIEPYLPSSSSIFGLASNSTSQREENPNCYANTILLRTTGDPAKAIAALRSAVATIDPNLPLLEVTTIREQVSNLVSHEELISTLTAIFALLALLLAAIGLYGVMSYNVARRTSEIGIRLALGAQGSMLVKMILRESMLLLLIGTGVGLPISYTAAMLFRKQMFEVKPLDPFTFSMALVVVAGTSLIASWVPARRAANVDPIAALRRE
jgi:predicted permease